MKIVIFKLENTTIQIQNLYDTMKYHSNYDMDYVNITIESIKVLTPETCLFLNVILEQAYLRG